MYEIGQTLGFSAFASGIDFTYERPGAIRSGPLCLIVTLERIRERADFGLYIRDVGESLKTSPDWQATEKLCRSPFDPSTRLRAG